MVKHSSSVLLNYKGGKTMDSFDILRYLKGMVGRMEIDTGYCEKTYPVEDIKRDLLQLLCKI